MSVRSENQRLRRVIVHQPGRAFEVLRPCNVKEKNPDYLLVDDLIFVKQARREHQILCAVLKTAAEVFEVTDLLEDLLKDSESRNLILWAMQVPQTAKDLPPNLLIEVILSGYWQNRSYALPCPNLIFTRDVAAVMGKAIIPSSAAIFTDLNSLSPRAREMELMRLIFKLHPLFNDYEVVEVPHHLLKCFSWEGGDFFSLSNDIAAIGLSERTKIEGVKAIAPAIFRQGFKRILLAHLRTDHSYMHLDTVFSMPSQNECLIFAAVVQNQDTCISKIEPDDPQCEINLSGSLVNVLEEQLQRNLAVYLCGGGDLIPAEQEQWTDGANLLALAPGLVVGYDRNEKTADRLAEHGYRILTAAEYLADPKPYLEDDVKALVLIPSGELSRARGGPRCLTLPIARD